MKKYFFTSALLCVVVFTTAQKIKNDWQKLKTDTMVYKRYTTLNASIGFGLSTALNKVPANIYKQSGSNFQLGFLIETSISKRISFVVGLEYNYLKFNLDAYPFINNNKLNITPAPDSIKYGSLHLQLIQMPLHIRYYFFNNFKTKPDIYFETGITISHKFSFSNNQSGLSYHYRNSNTSKDFSLNNFSTATPLWLDFLIGCKGNPLPSFSLLAGSSIGFSIQVNSLFNSNAAINFTPYYFTWKFSL